MKKFKCSYGYNEKIIESDNENDAKEEFISSLISDEEIDNYFLWEDLRFHTNVSEYNI